MEGGKELRSNNKFWIRSYNSCFTQHVGVFYFYVLFISLFCFKEFTCEIYTHLKGEFVSQYKKTNPENYFLWSNFSWSKFLEKNGWITL